MEARAYRKNSFGNVYTLFRVIFISDSVNGTVYAFLFGKEYGYQNEEAEGLSHRTDGDDGAGLYLFCSDIGGGTDCIVYSKFFQTGLF